MKNRDVRTPTRWLLLLTALPLIAFAGGCYASAGPTIGYIFPNGLTYGVEVDSAAVMYAHSNVGVFLRNADKTGGASKVSAFYASLGPGYYLAPSYQSMGTDVGAGFLVGVGGLGFVEDQERGTSYMAGLWGSPAIGFGKTREKPDTFFQLNLIVGVRFWDDKVMIYFSPQPGIGWEPYIKS